jgi:hypothetical protein
VTSVAAVRREFNHGLFGATRAQTGCRRRSPPQESLWLLFINLVARLRSYVHDAAYPVRVGFRGLARGSGAAFDSFAFAFPAPVFLRAF